MPPVEFRLYLVTDRHQTAERPLLPVVTACLEAGLQAVQLREKDLGIRDLLALADQARALTVQRDAVFLINDRVDLVQALGADGVHLRADSLPVSVVRRLLGPERFIGVSAHSSDDVERAEREGADFAVLGPIYDTPTKRRYGPPLGLGVLEAAARRSRLPVFAIGGVTVERVAEVRGAGAFGVAVVSSILSARDVSRATSEMLRALATSV